MILELLPEDSLERFSWCPWRSFKAENFQLLLRRQKKLKSVEVIRLDRDLTPELKKDEKLQERFFKAAKGVFLYPEDRASIALSGLFVQHAAPQLEELTLHANFRDTEDHFGTLLDMPQYIDPRELNDSAREPGLLTRTLFAHQLPFDKCKPFNNLTSLSLHRVNVRQAAETWCKVIDFNRMEFIHLYSCTGADALLDQLCKASHLPKQLKAFSLQHTDNEENETLLALDGFLCLVSGIRDLTIDIEHAKELPAPAGIARHGKTLETLNVHAWRDQSLPRSPMPPTPPNALPPGEERVYKQEQLETICNACKYLTQLSIGYPPSYINRCPNTDLHFWEFLIVSRLKRLITLNLTSWPTDNSSNGVSTLQRGIYETLLQSVALRIFKFASFWALQPPEAISSPDPIPIALPTEFKFTTASTPKLRIIAFGHNDRIYERQDGKSQAIFLRTTCVDAEGKVQLHAAPIGWNLKQYVEPASDVLNQTLLRTPTTPFPIVVPRERSFGGWADHVDDEVEIMDDP